MEIFLAKILSVASTGVVMLISSTRIAEADEDLMSRRISIQKYERIKKEYIKIAGLALFISVGVCLI